MAVETLTKVRNSTSGLDKTSKAEAHLIDEKILCWLDVLGNHLKRSQANEKRIHNEIQLAYNLVAQRDARASVEISETALKDSAAMKTVAVVTLAFLPATFVSTMFGTVFFDASFSRSSTNGDGSPSSDGLDNTGDGASARHNLVSKDVWIYFVISGPLTAITSLLWYWSQRKARRGGRESQRWLISGKRSGTLKSPAESV